MANITLFDIESTRLEADFGFVICASYKELGSKKIVTHSIDDYPNFKKDPTNDKFLLRDLKAGLEKADVLVGHYSTRFDLPFINGRLLHHGLTPVAPIPHVDTWRVSRNRLKITRNSLAALAEFFGFDEKTYLNKNIWVRASAGHRPSIKYIIEHCEQDVRVLEDVYTKIRVLAPDHPNINLTRFVTKSDPRCPICGSHKLQKRGYIIARTRRSPRYSCQECGSWSRGAPEKVDGIVLK